MGSRPAWPHRVSSNSVTVREPLCQTNKKQTDNKTTTTVTKRKKKKGGEKRGRKETPWFWSPAARQLLPSVCSDRF